MGIISVILSGLALLAAFVNLILFFREKKRSERQGKIMADYIQQECKGVSDAVEAHIEEAMEKFKSEHQDSLDSFSAKIFQRFQEYDNRIQKLEQGICPDFEKSMEAAKAVNDFNASITNILGFDPIVAARKGRQKAGEGAD